MKEVVDVDVDTDDDEPSEANKATAEEMASSRSIDKAEEE